MKKKLVTIIGRSNIGKSALFNKLADHKRALVLDSIGVTRDPIKDTSSWKGYQYDIADTAGFITQKNIDSSDPITSLAIARATQYLEEADILLFMIDGTTGYTQEDMQLFSRIKKLNKPIIIVFNKCDVKDSEESFIYMTALFQGYTLVKISAIHSININTLQDTIITLLPDSEKEHNDKKIKSKIAILGKPNVGKSSIMNILTEQNIAIVAPIAGTTRETISQSISLAANEYLISDTAGVRKSRAIEERIEELMVSNTMNTIQEADIVLMVFDISDNALHDQDIKLMSYAWNTLYKAILIVWNKIDLVNKNNDVMKIIEEKTSQYKHIFEHIPQITFSTIDDKHDKNSILEPLEQLSHRYAQFLDPKEIKMILRDALHHNPLFKTKQKLDFQKLDVVRSAPPTIVIYSRQKMLFSNSEIAFFQKQIRLHKDLLGVPIKIIIK
jgi:GTP-binding protein